MGEGRKDDQGKDRWDLVQPLSLNQYVKVLTHGAKKYGADNWKILDNPTHRYFAALLRHLWAWWMGQRHDSETGLHHLAHALCCICFLMEPELEEQCRKNKTI